MKQSWWNHLIELFIVIVGVSIAFWLNERAVEGKEAKIRSNYLLELRSDLADDIKDLDFVIKANSKKIDRITSATQLFNDADTHRDAIIEQSMSIGNYFFFTPENFTYQSMITSGDFKLIEEAGIKRYLVVLNSAYEEIITMQDNFIEALDENYFPYLLNNFDYLEFSPSNPNFHKSQTVKNIFVYTINDLSLHVKSYKRAQKLAQKLDSLIVTETGLLADL